MTSHSESPTVICDIDGCVVRSPSDSTIHDAEYWDAFWSSETDQIPNREVVYMLGAMLMLGASVVYVTGRPERARDGTLQMLTRLGLWQVQKTELRMLPDGFHGDIAKWKKVQAQSLVDFGRDVIFALEDFGPNVEELRTVVPVLRYEKFRNDAKGAGNVVS